MTTHLQNKVNLTLFQRNVNKILWKVSQLFSGEIQKNLILYI